MAQEVTTTITCAGGLDESSNSFQLFETPGVATKLQNYEVSIEGGYRRINGYIAYGTITPAGTTTENLGVFRYADGVISCQDTGVYFTTDGTTWIQVNKDGASAGLDVTALGSAAALARTNQGRNQFSIYEGAEEYGVLIITDGINEIAHFKITDIGGRKYYYEEVGILEGAPSTSTYNVIYKERSAVANDSQVYWSGRFTPNDFTLASAGAVDVGDKITGLKVHRDNLYVFCKNSIHVINNIDQAVNRQPVTRNVGCLDGRSIQEVGGDLIFLAQDGLRTIAGTDRIDDIELSTVSKKLNNTLPALTRDINLYDISSCVIRNKNQYRLFYTKSSQPMSEQQGIIGVLAYGDSGASWQWSTILGIEASVISSEVDKDTLEQIYHGDYDGNIYTHDSGASFNGSAIPAIYLTPDINFGDANLRKTLYTVKTSVAPETASDIALRIRYDFGSNDVMHPDDYSLNTVLAGAVWGAAVWGSFIYGATIRPLEKLNIEGSGLSASFRFTSDDTTSSYTVNGFYVDLLPSGGID